MYMLFLHEDNRNVDGILQIVFLDIHPSQHGADERIQAEGFLIFFLNIHIVGTGFVYVPFVEHSAQTHDQRQPLAELHGQIRRNLQFVAMLLSHMVFCGSAYSMPTIMKG